MADSYLQQPAGTGTNIQIEFEADYTYSLNRTLFKSNTMGRPNGAGALVSGGHSLGMLRGVNGIVVTETQTPEKVLWDEMDELVKSYTSSKQITRLRLYTDNQGGYLELDGWVQGFNADRSAKDGHAVIKITFDFIIKTKNTANLN